MILKWKNAIEKKCLHFNMKKAKVLESGEEGEKKEGEKWPWWMEFKMQKWSWVQFNSLSAVIDGVTKGEVVSLEILVTKAELFIM